jgi:hypothetical protein
MLLILGPNSDDIHSKKFANKELRAAHNAHHPQRAYHTQQYPAYITTTHYLKIPTTKYTTTQSTSPKPARGCPSGCVIEVCTMSAWPQIDRPRTLTSAPSCSLSSSLSTMADDALHTHKRNGTPWSGIRTRTAPSTVNTRRQPLSMQKRLAPCAKPTLRADAAALLALLATVHDGWQRPAHTLAHQPVRAPRRLPRTILFAPRDATRLAPCATPALSLMRPSCSLSSSLSTMACDSLHHHGISR